MAGDSFSSLPCHLSVEPAGWCGVGAVRCTAIIRLSSSCFSVLSSARSTKTTTNANGWLNFSTLRRDVVVPLSCLGLAETERQRRAPVSPISWSLVWPRVWWWCHWTLRSTPVLQICRHPQFFVASWCRVQKKWAEKADKMIWSRRRTSGQRNWVTAGFVRWSVAEKHVFK